MESCKRCHAVGAEHTGTERPEAGKDGSDGVWPGVLRNLGSSPFTPENIGRLST